MKTYLSWHQWRWDHVPVSNTSFTQPTFFSQPGCLVVTETLMQVHCSCFTSACSKQTLMSVEVAVTAWYSKPTRSMWALMWKQCIFMRRQRALNSLLLGLARQLQTLCRPELQPTTAGSGCGCRAVNLCLRSRTSQVQCSLSMGVKFQGWKYSLSILKDAAVRRGKLGWFTLRQCYTNSRNPHKGHEKQTD